jgi:transmembrane sensor
MSVPPLDPISEQAIDWMVALKAGTPDAALVQRLKLWLLQDPAHQQAWSRLEQRLGHPLAALHALDQRAPGQAAEARRLLLAPVRSRREVLGAMASLGLFGAALWGGWRSDTAQGWLADVHTGRGERRSVTLADGSHLSLNSASAVDIQFDAGQRLLVLRHGELLIQVARDPLRPLRVRTAQGQVQALGTRFLVSQEANATRVVVLEHSVRATLANGQWVELQQGQAALLHANRIERLATEQQQRAAWVAGRLEVLDEPLHAVIDALSPYQRGYIRVSPGVRDLRVQGVFALDQPQQALAALAEALPITVQRYGPWLTMIDQKTAK